MSTLKIQTPRVYLPLLSPARYKGAHGGRGSGKSHFFGELLIETCLLRETRAVCIREVQKSIKQSVKRLLDDKIQKLGVGHLFESLETEIRGPNNSLIIFQGMQNHTADSIKSLEGYDIAWVEEAQSLSQRSLDLLRPTIRKEGSELWFSWNPDQASDPVDELLRGDNAVEGVVVEANWRDNPFFPDVLRAEMEQDKARNYDKYLHVWEGHYNEVFEGAVYAEEIRQAITENRVALVPYEAMKPVHTFWDLGWADQTAIWFAQLIGMEYRIIDFYENRQKPIQHYMQMLQTRGYVYGQDWLPHDARAKSLGTGRSIEEILREAGRDVRITPNLSVADGINAARTIFNKCWFDEKKTRDGLDRLKRYRYEEQERGGFKRMPLHDENSHAADAFRYMGIALTVEPERKPLKYKSRGIV